MQDSLFTLDKLKDVVHYAYKGSYTSQNVMAKLGNDHVWLHAAVVTCNPILVLNGAGGGSLVRLFHLGGRNLLLSITLLVCSIKLFKVPTSALFFIHR